MSCGVGRRYGLDLVWLWLWLANSTSSLGTSICRTCGLKKKLKKNTLIRISSHKYAKEDHQSFKPLSLCSGDGVLGPSELWEGHHGSSKGLFKLVESYIESKQIRAAKQSTCVK